MADNIIMLDINLLLLMLVILKPIKQNKRQRSGFMTEKNIQYIIIIKPKIKINEKMKDIIFLIKNRVEFWNYAKNQPFWFGWKLKYCLLFLLIQVLTVVFQILLLFSIL